MAEVEAIRMAAAIRSQRPNAANTSPKMSKDVQRPLAPLLDHAVAKSSRHTPHKHETALARYKAVTNNLSNLYLMLILRHAAIPNEASLASTWALLQSQKHINMVQSKKSLQPR